MAREPVLLGGLIDYVINSLGLGDRYHGWQIVKNWPDMVGPDIARHSRAERFSEGVLTVIVEKDVWRQELEMQRERLMERIRSRPGGAAVKKIVFKAGSSME